MCESWGSTFKGHNFELHYFPLFNQWSDGGFSSPYAFQKGTNLVAAELHVANSSREIAAFDLEFSLSSVVDCPDFSLDCARKVNLTFLEVSHKALLVYACGHTT